MAINLFSLFGGRQQAVQQALRQSERQRMQQSANAVAAGTARSGNNPLAAARTIHQMQANERASMADQRARALGAAKMGEQEDISQLIGTGIGMLGSIGGMALGGPAGAAAGQAGGSAVQAALGAGTQALNQAPTQPRPAFSTDQDPLRRGAPFVETDIELERLFGLLGGR